MDPMTIFHVEAEEALISVKVSIRNLKEFKTCFQEYKEKIPTYFNENDSYKPWDFKVNNFRIMRKE